MTPSKARVPRWIAGHVLCAAIVLGACSIGITRRIDVDKYDRWHTRPKLDRLERALQRHRDALLIGNSLVGWGVDERRCRAGLKESGFTSSIYVQDAAGSPFWYLVLKNWICTAPDKPGTLVIVSARNQLTSATFNSTGKHSTALSIASRGSEPELHRRLALNYWLEQRYTDLALGALRRWWPAYDRKNSVRSWFFSRWTNWPRPLLLRIGDADRFRFSEAFRRSLPRQNLQGRYYNRITAYSRMAHRDRLDFKANVQTSFLPLMIDLCREHDIRLCMVLFKARSGWGPEGLERDRKLRDYTRELASYLESRDVALIDYTQDAYIDESCFSLADHMNRKGKAYITPRLTQDLVEFLRDTDAFDE